MEFLHLPKPDRDGLEAVLAEFNALPGRSTRVRFEREEGRSIVGYYDERQTAALGSFLSMCGFRAYIIGEDCLLPTERSQLTAMREAGELKMVREDN